MQTRDKTASQKTLKQRSAAGFTLLETLIALAIISLVTLATFQSTTQMLRLSATAVEHADRSLNARVDRLALSDMVGSAIIAYGERVSLLGSETGLSADVIHGIALQPYGWERIDLNIDQGQLTLSQNGQPPIRLAVLAPDAQFSYRGTDGIWRNRWPPEDPIPFHATAQGGAAGRSITAQDHLYGDAPKLPQLMRIDGVLNDRGTRIFSYVIPFDDEIFVVSNDVLDF